MSSAQQIRRQGFILTEACVALALIGLVLAAATLLLIQHSRATEHFINYRRAQLAAESCMERMRAEGLKAVGAEFTDENDIAYDIQVSEAEGEWKPLSRVSVAATITAGNRRVARYTIIAYVDGRRASGDSGS